MSKKTLVNKLYLAIALLSFIAFAVSVIIEVNKLSSSDIAGVCSAVKSSCDAVQGSMYGKTFGIDNPYFGMVGFLVLVIISFWQYSKTERWRFALIAAGVFVAGAVALYFIYLQAFVLHAYCAYCIIVDVISFILVGIVVRMLLKRQYL